MKSLIIYPKTKEQLSALKAIVKPLKIDFEIIKSPYNPDFVAKIKKIEKEVADGKFITLDPNKPLFQNLK